MWYFLRGGMFCCLIIVISASAAAQDIRVVGDRLFLPVQINGRPVEALLDSGAEMTVIDTKTARALGLTASGSAEARGTGKGTQQAQFVQGVEIVAAGVVLRDRTVAVLDLSDISMRIVGEPVNAIMGRDLFDAGRFHLDIEQQRFGQVPRDATPSGVRLALTDAKGIKQIPIRIDGGDEIRADFDLGNGGEMLIGRSYAQAHGLLSDDRVIGTRTGGGIGGAVERQIVRVERVEIAGTVFRNVEAAIDSTPDAPDANVGVALLRHFELTIDFDGNAVWLRAIE